MAIDNLYKNLVELILSKKYKTIKLLTRQNPAFMLLKVEETNGSITTRHFLRAGYKTIANSLRKAGYTKAEGSVFEKDREVWVLN